MTNPAQAKEHLDEERINAFIDAELTSNEAREVQQHVADCHRCALRILSATQLKAATARSAQRFAASPETLNRLGAQLRPRETRKFAPTRALGWFAWIAVAAIVIFSVATIGWLRVRHADALSAELLDQHLATISSAASLEVLSTDRHTVKPWFQGKLPFSFNLPDGLPADTSLKGGDLTYLNGQPAALLLFTVHKHEVSVFLTQRAGGFAPATPTGVRSGFVIHEATTSELRIVAISDVNPVELDLLLSAVVQAQMPH